MLKIFIILWKLTISQLTWLWLKILNTLMHKLVLIMKVAYNEHIFDKDIFH